jgi:hypothetical protein
MSKKKAKREAEQARREMDEMWARAGAMYCTPVAASLGGAALGYGLVGLTGLTAVGWVGGGAAGGAAAGPVGAAAGALAGLAAYGVYRAIEEAS